MESKSKYKEEFKSSTPDISKIGDRKNQILPNPSSKFGLSKSKSINKVGHKTIKIPKAFNSIGINTDNFIQLEKSAENSERTCTQEISEKKVFKKNKGRICIAGLIVSIIILSILTVCLGIGLAVSLSNNFNNENIFSKLSFNSLASEKQHSILFNNNSSNDTFINNSNNSNYSTNDSISSIIKISVIKNFNSTRIIYRANSSSNKIIFPISSNFVNSTLTNKLVNGSINRTTV